MVFIIITTALCLGVLFYLMFPTIRYYLLKWYNNLPMKTKERIGYVLFSLGTTLYYLMFYYCTKNILPEYNIHINILISMILATFIFVFVFTVIVLIISKTWYDEQNNTNEDDLLVESTENEEDM